MKRISYIDNLKGVLILLVVLGHCIQSTDANYDHNLVFRYIYSFHMPLFMCVSGFVSYKPNMTWQTVQKRFKQLIVPFLAWSLLGCCMKWNFSTFPDKILYPDTGLWFLWTLFFIALMMKLCDIISSYLKIKLEYVACILSLLLMGMMILLKIKVFGFQFIAWYFPFYTIGFWGRKYQSLWENQERIASLCLSTLFLFMAYWWMRKTPPLFMAQDSHVIYNYIYKFIVAVISIAALIPLFKHYTNKTILIITKLGGVTLGIYAIHQSIITLLIALFDIDTIQLPYWVNVCCLFSLVSIISYLCYIVIGRNRYLSILFLGK